MNYELLAQQKQINFQNTADKSIDGPVDFIQKCGFDIVAQMALGLLGALTASTPVFYDLVISGSAGGMQCYNLYNQAGKRVAQMSAIETIIPYITDAATLCLMASKTHFDFATQVGQILTIKQSLAMMSSVVMTDHMTKLLLSSIQETSLVESFNQIIEDVYSYLTGECYAIGQSFDKLE